MYKITTDKDYRIIEIEYTETPGPDVVEDYPGSPIDDYKYIDGQVVYDPIPDRPTYDPSALDGQPLEKRVNDLEDENREVKSMVQAMAKAGV